MEFKISSNDPIKILETTKGVLEDARFVFISEENIEKTAKIAEAQLEEGLDVLGEGFKVTNTFQDNVQLTFLEDAANFCFWSDLGQPRWQVEFPKSKFTEGGWFGLQKCFKRALAEGVPILDANYISEITLEQTRELFRSSNEYEIPLIEERQKNLREAGRVLLEKYDGKFINALEKSGGDAVELVKIVCNDFSSFRDVSALDGKEIFFLKRAQIVANDIAFLSEHDKRAELKNLGHLTAFADYKIPQILRAFGVISYSSDLADRVDKGTHVSHGSREEIEIRSATVWSVEIMKQVLGEKYSAAEIDNALWFLSQDKKGMLPYHRTRTIFY